MTPKEIDRISRSWVGHIATNPALRVKMIATVSDAEYADLINETVVPNYIVRPEDVPAIKERTAEMFKDIEQPEPGKAMINHLRLWEK